MRRSSGGRVRGVGPEMHGSLWWSAKEEAEKRGTEERVDGGEGGRRREVSRVESEKIGFERLEKKGSTCVFKQTLIIRCDLIAPDNSLGVTSRT